MTVESSVFNFVKFDYIPKMDAITFKRITKEILDENAELKILFLKRYAEKLFPQEMLKDALKLKFEPISYAKADDPPLRPSVPSHKLTLINEKHYNELIRQINYFTIRQKYDIVLKIMTRAIKHAGYDGNPYYTHLVFDKEEVDKLFLDLEERLLNCIEQVANRESNKTGKLLQDTYKVIESANESIHYIYPTDPIFIRTENILLSLKRKGIFGDSKRHPADTSIMDVSITKGSEDNKRHGNDDENHSDASAKPRVKRAKLG